MATSKLQQQVSILLSTHLGQYTIRENHRPDWLDGLELDFYIEELQVGIEVQGQQHFAYTPYFHSSYEAFLDQKDRDEQKASLCSRQDVKLYYLEHVSEALQIVEQLLDAELPISLHPNFIEQTKHDYIPRELGGKRSQRLSSLHRKATSDTLFAKYLAKAVGQEKAHGINEKAKRYAQKAAQRAIDQGLELKARHYRILKRILEG